MMRSLKYSKDVNRRIKAFPERVSFGDVSPQNAAPASIGVKDQGDMVGRQAVLTVAYESGQRMSANKTVHHLGPFFEKMAHLIH